MVATGNAMRNNTTNNDTTDNIERTNNDCKSLRRTTLSCKARLETYRVL